MGYGDFGWALKIDVSSQAPRAIPPGWEFCTVTGQSLKDQG